eukprot:500150_1
MGLSKQNRNFALLCLLILLLLLLQCNEQLKLFTIDKNMHIDVIVRSIHNNNTSQDLYWTNLSAEKINAKSSVNKKINILIVFGSDTDLMKIAPILWEYDKYRSKQYQNLSIFCLFTFEDYNSHNNLINKLNVTKFINFELFLNKTDNYNQIDHLSSITIKLITGISTILHDFANIFDLVLVQGDTTTAMATSIAIFYHTKQQNICLAHIDAGLRTFNVYKSFPKEINRQFISKMATFHFASSIWSKINLIKNDNISPTNIVVIGNTVIDTVKYIYDKNQFVRDEFNDYLTNNNLHINTDKYKYGLLSLFNVYMSKKQNIYNILDSIYEILILFQDLHFIHPIPSANKYINITSKIYQWIGEKFIESK